MSDKDVSGDSGSRSFLQQTTSQLLHQQEALRRRREVLERESRKPPAMRFGLNSPVKSRSPAPRTVSMSPPPVTVAVPVAEVDNSPIRDARREPAPPLVSQPPMRFSLSYRPTPTPAVAMNASLRTTSVSPAPLQVNQMSACSRSRSQLGKRIRSPRSTSPGPPVQRKRRGEDNNADARGSWQVRDIPVEIYLPQRRPSQLLHGEERAPEVEVGEECLVAPSPMSDMSRTSGDYPVEASDGAPTPVSQNDHDDVARTLALAYADPPRASNQFALPQYSPSQVALSRLSNLNYGSMTPGRIFIPEIDHQQQRQRGSVLDSSALSNDEFATPRPVISRISNSGLPLPPPRTFSDLLDDATGDDGSIATPTRQLARMANPESLICSNEKGETAPASPIPTTEDVLASFDASAEKACCDRPSPKRRAESPAPTPQKLIDSVLAAAAAAASSDKRKCGCERTTPTQSPLSRPNRTLSPPPTPVHSREEDTSNSHFSGRSTRPTPASMSESVTNAAQTVSASKACSPSPYPTTDNIVQSIEVSADKYRGRREEVGRDTMEDSADSEPNLGISTPTAEEQRTSRTASPALTPTHIISSIQALADKPAGKSDAMSRSETTVSACSPAPTDVEIAASVITSLEKRRCGRPTPQSGSRAAPSPLAMDNNHSASPAPTTSQLLESLGVTADRSNNDRSDAPTTDRDGPGSIEGGGASCMRKRSVFSRLPMDRTPSPIPTEEQIQSSVLASAEKRKRHERSEPISDAMSRSYQPAGADLAPPPPCPVISIPSYSGQPNDLEMEAGSPKLTAQHISDSVRKMADDKSNEGARSNAPPVPEGRPTSLSLTAPNTSPEVTAEHIQESIEVLKEELAVVARKRSGSVAPAHAPGTSLSAVPPVRVEEEEDTVFSNFNSEGDDEEQKKAEGDDNTNSAVPCDSPASSDVCADSALFKDCVSPAPTPALAHLPPQFLALQRDVQAISEGRSRAGSASLPAVPPAPHRVPSVRARRSWANPDPREEQETPTPSTDFMAAAAAIFDKTVQEAVAAARPVDQMTPPPQTAGRRSSMVLVDDRAEPAFTTLIQEPHHPMPTAPSRTPPPVSIPRTPTPPQRQVIVVDPEGEQRRFDREVQAGGPTVRSRSRVGLMQADSHYEPSMSPLPRPVTLSSQVVKSGLSNNPSRTPPPQSLNQSVGHRAVVKAPAPIPAASVSQPPPSATAAPLAAPFSISPREGRSTPYPRGSTIIQDLPANEEEVAAEEEDVRVSEDATRESLTLVSERGSGRTFTVAPQDGAVVFMSHGYRALMKRSCDPAEDDNVWEDDDEDNNDTATAETSSTSAARSDSRVSLVVRSSGSGGRRSTFEKLLDMLPKDSQDEIMVSVAPSGDEEGGDVTRMSNVSIDSQETPARGRRTTDTVSSEASDSGSAGSIAERVGQRERKAYYDYNYYLKYMGHDSATKSRETAGNRMQQKIAKDVANGPTSPAQQAPSSGRKSARKTPLPPQTPPSAAKMPEAEDTPSAKRRRTETATAPSPNVDVEVSPLTPSVVDDSAVVPSRVTATGRKLSVMTRLSAELRNAIFAPASSGTASGAMSPNLSPNPKKSPATPAEPKQKKAKVSKKLLAKKSKKALRKQAKKEAAAVAIDSTTKKPSPKRASTSPVKKAAATPAESPTTVAATAPKSPANAVAVERKEKKKLKKKLSKMSPSTTTKQIAMKRSPETVTVQKSKKLRKVETKARKANK